MLNDVECDVECEIESAEYERELLNDRERERGRAVASEVHVALSRDVGAPRRVVAASAPDDGELSLAFEAGRGHAGPEDGSLRKYERVLLEAARLMSGYFARRGDAVVGGDELADLLLVLARVGRRSGDDLRPRRHTDPRLRQFSAAQVL